MFKKGRDKELETAYDKRRAMMFNRMMCIIVGGVLLYMFIQAFFESEPMPFWYPIAMVAMLIGVAVLLVWNVRAVKKFDKEQAELAEMEEQQKLLAPQPEEIAPEEEKDINDSPYDS